MTWRVTQEQDRRREPVALRGSVWGLREPSPARTGGGGAETKEAPGHLGAAAGLPGQGVLLGAGDALQG